jgi:anaerobic dimethyl sulfoxide reductase subunit A
LLAAQRPARRRHSQHQGDFLAGSDWFNQLTNINKEIEAIKKLELVVCMDSTITPSGIWADVLLPIATHFERHDVALPWYKGHYYIHRPKVIEPLGESKTDFQVFTELSYRLEMLDPTLQGLGRRYNPRADRSYFLNPDAVDEQYLTSGGMKTESCTTSMWICRGNPSKNTASTSSSWHAPTLPFRTRSKRVFLSHTPSGKIEIFSTQLANITDWKRTQYGYEIPAIPKWIEPFESLNHPLVKKFPFHLITPHPRERTHSIYHNIPWLRETCQPGSDTQRQRCKMHWACKRGIRGGGVQRPWQLHRARVCDRALHAQVWRCSTKVRMDGSG